jgi:hypothetical protein
MHQSMVGLDAAAPADLVELLAPLSVVASAAPACTWCIVGTGPLIQGATPSHPLVSSLQIKRTVLFSLLCG